MKGKLLEKWVSGFAHRLGYTIVPNWRMETYQGAKFLRRLLDLYKVDCVIDVGANRGQYRHFLRTEVGFDGLIASFEPIPDHAAYLREAAQADSRWIVSGTALGAAPGQLEFNVMANTEFSSFLAPRDDNTSRFQGGNTVARRVQVEVDTLARVVPELRSKSAARSIYLKLDTQGFDLEVLKGAGDALQDICALQSEMSVRPIYDGMPRYSDVVTYLEECGFAMSGIFPNNAGHFPLLIEFDGYFCRPEAASPTRAR